MNCTLLRLGTAVLLPVAALALTTGPAGAAAPTDGCPSGYTLLSVGELTEQGYRVPAEMDSPDSGFRSFGRVGNDDGSVCGVKLGKQLTSFDAPIYNFLDNQLPA